MTDAPGPDRAFFDLWSLFYDLPWVQRLTYRPVQDAVMRELRESRRRRVLDVGCGTGLLAARIRKELRGSRVVGCDFSRGMLQRARGRSRRVSWVRGDALRLPFSGASFDAVVSTEAFHWFPDQRTALAEFFRVLTPRGRLCVALVNPPLEWMSEATHLGSQLLGEPLFWPTRRGMRERVEEAGFHVEAQRRVFRVPAGLVLPTFLTVAARPG
jgi:ubiquinone/menaquinone biosynthesis C-methylase UbiE